MPDCYTHVLIGQQALMRSGHTVASQPAFMAGANGPDPLYMYQAWRGRRKPDLSVLAKRMHREKTGQFLLALIENAATPVQQSYVLGFISHYTTDCTLHPWVAANTAPGAAYSGKNGHLRMEAALDSTLYYRNFKTYRVPLHAGTPVLVTEDLAQVTALLRATLAQVYERDISLLILADTFHQNLINRKRLVTRTGFKRLFIRLFEPSGRRKGALSGKIQPAPPLKTLPDSWVNPFTGAEMNLTQHEVLALAEQTGALCLTAAMRYWLGEMHPDKLAAILGNNDYYTGLPCQPPKAKSTPKEPDPAEPGNTPDDQTA